MTGILNKARQSMSALGVGRWSPIGLDVGAESVRAIQLHRVSRVSNAARPDFQIQALSQSHRSGDPQQVAETPSLPDESTINDLKRVLSHEGFHGHDVITGLDSCDLSMAALDLPVGTARLEDKQIRSALTFELGRHIGYDPDQAEVRAWRLPPGNINSPTVMGVAVRRDTVCRWLQAVEHAAYRCIRIDAAACALVRACTLLHKPQYDSIWGVLDIGKMGSRLIVAACDIPMLQRDIAAGGAMWTFRVAESMKLSLEAAEQLKIEHGILSDHPQCENRQTGASAMPDEEPAAGDESLEPSVEPERDETATYISKMNYTALRKSLSSLAQEVEKSMAYAMHTHADLPVSALYLAGGGAGMRGITEILSRTLGIQVIRTDPFAVMSGPPRQSAPKDGHAWTKAVGLALLGAAMDSADED